MSLDPADWDADKHENMALNFQQESINSIEKAGAEDTPQDEAYFLREAQVYATLAVAHATLANGRGSS